MLLGVATRRDQVHVNINTEQTSRLKTFFVTCVGYLYVCLCESHASVHVTPCLYYITTCMIEADCMYIRIIIIR